ncbi:BON domain-containing protein [Acidobacteriota bacterium]
MKNKMLVMFGILLLAAGSMLAHDKEDVPVPLEQQIRDAVLSSPRYGVFDAVFFDLQGNELILKGHVVQPIIKEEIGIAVSRIKSLEKVQNDIEVLPLSSMDNSIRRQIYHKLFGIADMYKYAMGAYPSIHIIVKHGHVSLEGYVSSDSDKKLALLASRGILGVFSIENNLIIDK